ncbi:MAG: TonB-dependent receptor [Muribaculaceae bacterium]|nr:TonB-dependent receptor [Muribaculaceae bacterium]
MNLSQKIRLWLAVLLATTFSLSLSAQDITVKGLVSDDTGEPLMGATVLLKGTQKGVASNLDGEFSISAPSNGTLVFSYIGCKTKEVAINGQTTLNVTLENNTEMLDEVVAIGYGTVKKKDLTGAVSSVSGTELVKVPVATAAAALQGKAAGLNIVSQNGAPGASMNVTVRGGASLTQGTEPLYIVDGFAMDNALSNIDINDIETIDVLKDASATAIYGARGSNGIIVITTKSGQKGKTKVDYNAYFSWDKLAKKLDVNDNALDYAWYQYEFAELQGKQFQFSSVYDGGYGTSETDYHSNAYNRLAERYANDYAVDWQDLTFGGHAFTQNHNVSVSTGGEKTQFLLSYNHNDQDGLLANHDFKRNSIRAKINTELWKGVKLDFGMFFYHNNTHGGGSYSGMKSVLLQPINGGTLYTEDELIGTQTQPTYRGYDNTYSVSNPLVQNGAVVSEKRSRKLDLNGGITVDFLNDFRWRTAVNYTTGWDKSTSFQDENSLNYLLYQDTEGMTGSIGNSEKFAWRLNNTLTWTKTFNKVHDFTVMVGQEYSYSESEGNSISLRKFPVPNHKLDDISKAEVSSKSTSHSNGNMLSFFGRVNYSYDDRYLLTATFRADGSSKFAKGHKWGYFPSASGAWRVSQEKFWTENPVSDWFNNLKFRIGYGVTGNCDIASNMYTSTLSMTTYPMGNDEFSPAFTTSETLGNPDLKWETLHATNVGLDLGMFNNRINLSVEWYNNQISDMLMLCTIPSSTGYTKQYQNIGKMRNRGWEFTLNTVNIASHGFQWTSTLNMSFNKSKVIALEGEVKQKTFSAGDNRAGCVNYYAVVGHGLGDMYGYKYDGIYTTDDFDELPDGTWQLKEGVVKPEDGRTAQPGDIKFAADNEDGTQFTKQAVKIGNGTPDFFGGFSNQFTYKGFDLNVFMKFAVGNDVYNATKHSMSPYAAFENTPKEFSNNYYRLVDPATGLKATSLERLRQLNPDESSRTWSLTENNSSYITYPSSYFVEDGSYLRLAQVTLGYTLPQKWTRKALIQNLRVYFTANNLCTITGYSGYDPDASSKNDDVICTPGYDSSTYPMSRSYVVGLNLTF